MTFQQHNNTSHENSAGLPALVSIRQIAEAANLSRGRVRKLINEGKLPAIRLGPRCIRVERDAVLELLKPA